MTHFLSVFFFLQNSQLRKITLDRNVFTFIFILFIFFFLGGGGGLKEFFHQ